MSDSLEKFVLQYVVDLKDSINRLEQFNNKVTESRKKGKESGDTLKDIFKNVHPEIGKATNKIETFFGKFRTGTTAMAASAGVAIAALAAMAAASERLNKSLQEQRLIGASVGMSQIQVEQQRRTLNASGGLSQSESAALLGKVSERVSSGYQNIDPTSQERIRLRMVGINATGANGQRTSTSAAVDQLAAKLQSVSKDQAMALGANIGLSEREVDALRNRTAALVDSTKMTKEEIVQRQLAIAASQEMTKAQGVINDNWEKIKDVFGEMFLPLVADFTKDVSEFVQKVPGALHTMIDNVHEFIDLANAWQAKILHPIDNRDKSVEEIYQRMRGERKAAEAKALKDAANDEKLFENQKAQTDQNERAIKMFGAAVTDFKDSVDTQSDEFMAAWAGDVGKAGGLNGIAGGMYGNGGAMAGGGHAPIGGYSPPAGGGQQKPSVYDAEIEKVWGPYAEIGKAIMRQESGGDPTQKNKTSTASGLFQVLRQSWLPGENPFDASTSIRQGYRVFMEKMRAGKGDEDWAIKHYGTNTDQYVREVRARMPGGALRTQDATKGFDNVPGLPVRDDKQRDSDRYFQRKDAEKIAASMGLPFGQMNRPGQVGSADLAIASRTHYIQMLKEFTAAKMQMDTFNNDPMANPLQKGAAQKRFVAAQRDLSAAQANYHSMGGDRNVDSSQRQFTWNNTFNIGAGTTPEQVKQMSDALHQQMKAISKDIVNDRSNGIKM